MAILFQKLLPNRFFNCPLLPTSQNILAGELPTTQKFLDTPLVDMILFPKRKLAVLNFDLLLSVWH
jgi:hypothetical protein